MTALVTGATGLIGNAIAQRLAREAETVRALVRDPARAAPLLPAGIETLAGDITDPETLPAAMRDVDVVYHAAGMPEQWQRDESVFDRVNREGTANVLRAALDAGVRRVVYTSTMDVFREGSDGMLRETEVDSEPKPSAYERSKQAAEREADRVAADGLDVVFLNPSSVYGPTATTTGMTEFFVRLCNRKAPMMPPGGASLAYVESVADAHVAAASRGTPGERYLLADTHATMRELAEVTARVAGLRRVPPVAPRALLKTIAAVSAPLARTFGFTPLIAPGQLGFLLWNAKIDASKARAQLGYRPMPLEDGVRATIEDLRRRGRIPRA